ncbi:RICIN domain-containing protein [Saccharothrix sp.]|uniref:RICIN domain-containing protein n=1 Tax=Saccharothrix sp. TaxID=1873460 RepID=UPI0028114F2B|nr:RICIN domain-containing protein [Saccharothrix sp.]
MSLFRHALVAFATLVLTLGLTPAVQAKTDDVGILASVRIINLHTGRCLAIQGSNNVNGSPAFQYDCIGSAADQHWNIEYISAGRSRIRNAYTGRCLAVQGANNVNGAPAFQHDCAGYEDQNWNIFDEGSGGRYVKIQNSYTQRCLVIRGADNFNGSRAFQFDCLNYQDQKWVLQTV